jgi:hypothetical protein
MSTKYDRITVRITSEIRAMLDKQRNESEPDSLLIRRAISLGLELVALAEEFYLPLPKPNSLRKWINEIWRKTPKEDKAIRFIKLLANGDMPSNADIALLADDLDIDVKNLTLVRDGAMQHLKLTNVQKNEYTGHPEKI